MRLVSLQAITSNYSAILQEVDEKEKNTAGVKAEGIADHRRNSGRFSR